MALGGQSRHNQLRDNPLLLQYLRRLFTECILPAAVRDLGVAPAEVSAVFEEWIGRLCHRTFSMDVMFVAQNASLKLGARLLASAPREGPSQLVFAFAVAVMLRFLTPTENISDCVFSVWFVAEVCAYSICPGTVGWCRSKRSCTAAL